MKPFFRQLGFSGSGQQTPTSFPNSFPASENLTESIFQTPADASDGSQTINLGLPMEADMAITIMPSLGGGAQTIILGLAIETDTARGLSITLQLGSASETDTALTITSSLASGGITIPLMTHHYSQQRDTEVQYLRQSTASQSVLIGPFVDSTDGVTAETGLTIVNTDIRLSKNGGSMAAKNSGGGTHDENGWYTITLDATDTNTVGRLQVSCVVAGALPVHMEFQVVEEAVYDESLASGADGVFSADIVQINASAAAAAALERATEAEIVGTVGSGSTTTSIVASSLTPASAVDDAWIGRQLMFAGDTTTAALRGQVQNITDYVHSTTTFTTDAFTTSAVSGDTFIVI